MGAQVNYRNPPLNFCLLHLSLLIEGFDCGLPWAIKTCWKSKGWLVLLLLVCHITVLVLWIPCDFLSVFFESTLFPLWIFPAWFLSKIQSSSFFPDSNQRCSVLCFCPKLETSNIQCCKTVILELRMLWFSFCFFSSRETSSFGFRKWGNASTLQASILLQAEVLQGWRY